MCSSTRLTWTSGFELITSTKVPMPRTRTFTFEYFRRKLLLIWSPPYDQCLQWSMSFDSLLHDKRGLVIFKEYLKSEFSEENLEFWMACERYRFANESKMPVLARKIHSDFLEYQAPKEVNLDSFTRMVTSANLKNPSRDTFQKAQQKIQALMEMDSYPRFISSEIYQQLLKKVSSM